MISGSVIPGRNAQTFRFWYESARDGCGLPCLRARRARRCGLDPLTELGALHVEAVGHRPGIASGVLQLVLGRRDQCRLVATVVHLHGLVARHRRARLDGSALFARPSRRRVAHARCHDCQRVRPPRRRTLGGVSPRWVGCGPWRIDETRTESRCRLYVVRCARSKWILSI